MDPVQTRILRPEEETTVTLECTLIEGLCGQYYADASIWATYNVHTGILDTQLDDTIRYDRWNDRETGMTSFFWLPRNSVCISGIMFDRVPARVSQREIACNAANHFYDYKDQLDFVLSTGLSVYVDVFNNSADTFAGYVSFSHLLDPKGEVYKKAEGLATISDLKPGKKTTVVLPVSIAPGPFDYTGARPGTWQVPVELKQGWTYPFAKTVETELVSFEVIAHDQDIATIRPGGTVIPISYHPSETLKWLTAMELWGAVLGPLGTIIDAVEAMSDAYKQHLEDLDQVNSQLSDTAQVTIRKEGVVDGQCSLSVEWRNFLWGGAASSAYYDRCVVGVKIPAGIEIVAPDATDVEKDSEGNIHLVWDIQRLGKQIAPGDGGYLRFKIRQPPNTISIEATEVLMVGPYLGKAGESYEHTSDYPWIINYEEGDYWYALSGDTDTIQIPGTK